MKGLILCAGKGTRLHPITLKHSKTLMPVANIPMLQTCMEKLVEQGIAEIGICIHPSQEADIRERIGNGESLGVTVTYIYQNEAKGISDAVKQAQPYIGEDAFLLLLGDNLIAEPLTELKADVEERGSHGSLLLAEVENPQDYGIAEVLDGRIAGLEEKPRNPKSNLAVLGAYAFNRSIFKAVRDITPSARGEYEITDAIQWLVDHNFPVTYHITEKLNMDVGTVDRWLEANRRTLDQTHGGGTIHETAIVNNCTIIAPVIIGQGCVLKDSVIGPYVSIGTDSHIEDCRIENSIILNEVHLKHISYTLKDTVIGFGSVMAGIHPRVEGSGQ
ncbi:sugar phosphate nucleotidyltransferase [Paenibacillus arenilitoris]|uniref:NTP transferase domain-containing protein n=1 Tax=Paenibacillus arenilitoris TaxID=2772299 RepID=A0A927H5N0_9BACL|nr:sugar phosphate nucleotidyltransferase [Paenibacillus arenilitoris]MBD2868713.1 NTP transferase domain-containing protein [Paenibacillus arenilitoris]